MKGWREDEGYWEIDYRRTLKKSGEEENVGNIMKCVCHMFKLYLMHMN